MSNYGVNDRSDAPFSHVVLVAGAQGTTAAGAASCSKRTVWL